MFKFIKDRKAKADAKKFREGWDFAAGRILEDGPEVAIALLESNLFEARVFSSFNSFDKGIEAAIKRWDKFDDSVKLVTEEMRERKVGHNKQKSPSLIGWASRIDIAFDRIGNDN